MLLIISFYVVFIIASGVTLLLSYIEYGYRRNYWTPNLIRGFVATTCTAAAISILISLSSYKSYLDMLSYYNTITQYEEAVQMYENSIVLNLDKVVTDFTYQGHAKTVADLIKDLRNKVVKYNSILVTKKAMARNPFFKFLIVRPDTYMKIIHIKKK